MAKGKMQKWKRAPPAWIDAFDASLPDTVERRKMFGDPAAFVNGNMAAGLHANGLVLRLDEKDRDALQKIGGQPFVVMGRTMTGYLLAPDDFTETPAELKKWLARSVAYAKSLPPKAKRKK